MYLATNPPAWVICSAQQRWYAPMISRMSSGSRRAERAVEPTRSQNITVSWRRSAEGVGCARAGAVTAGVAVAPAPSAVIALPQFEQNLAPGRLPAPHDGQ